MEDILQKYSTLETDEVEPRKRPLFMLHCKKIFVDLQISNRRK